MSAENPLKILTPKAWGYNEGWAAVGVIVGAGAVVAMTAGGGEARADAPQTTPKPQEQHSMRNIPEKPSTLLVDLSKQPTAPLRIK